MRASELRECSDDELVVKERGGLDWLICCAGIIRDRVSWKLTDAEWSDVLAACVTLSVTIGSERDAQDFEKRSIRFSRPLGYGG